MLFSGSVESLHLMAFDSLLGVGPLHAPKVIPFIRRVGGTTGNLQPDVVYDWQSSGSFPSLALVLQDVWQMEYHRRFDCCQTFLPTRAFKDGPISDTQLLMSFKHSDWQVVL